MKKTIKIEGMHCASCEILLTEAIQEAGVKVISAKHEKGEIIVEIPSEKILGKIYAVIEKEGYTAKKAA